MFSMACFFEDDGGFTCEVEEYVKSALRAICGSLNAHKQRLLWDDKGTFFPI
jgi:hypothetical protein